MKFISTTFISNPPAVPRLSTSCSPGLSSSPNLLTRLVLLPAPPPVRPCYLITGDAEENITTIPEQCSNICVITDNTRTIQQHL